MAHGRMRIEVLVEQEESQPWLRIMHASVREFLAYTEAQEALAHVKYDAGQNSKGAPPTATVTIPGGTVWYEFDVSEEKF